MRPEGTARDEDACVPLGMVLDRDGLREDPAEDEERGLSRSVEPLAARGEGRWGDEGVMAGEGADGAASPVPLGTALPLAPPLLPLDEEELDFVAVIAADDAGGEKLADIDSGAASGGCWDLGAVCGLEDVDHLREVREGLFEPLLGPLRLLCAPLLAPPPVCEAVSLSEAKLIPDEERCEPPWWGGRSSRPACEKVLAGGGKKGSGFMAVMRAGEGGV